MKAVSIRWFPVIAVVAVALITGCAGLSKKGGAVVVVTGSDDSEATSESGSESAGELPVESEPVGDEISEETGVDSGSAVVILDDIAMEAEYPMVTLDGPRREPIAIGRYEVTNELLTAMFNTAIESGRAALAGASLIRDGVDLLDLESTEYGENTGIYEYGGRLGVADGRADHPAVGVTWFGAVVFCNLLSAEAGLEPVYDLDHWVADTSLSGYRLPTFEEWAWAGVGGQQSSAFAYPGSDDPSDVAWYADTSGGSTRPVGTLQPNQIGLYDIVGNVWEWCWDSFDSAFDGSGQDDSDTASGPLRGWAGCGWNTEGLRGWADFPNIRSPDTSDNDLGFRLVRRP